jgi:hypothetical protein
MSDDEKRKALLHAITVWRDIRDAYPRGSPQYKHYQRKMKEAECKLHALGSPDNFSFDFVDPDKPK